MRFIYNWFGFATLGAAIGSTVISERAANIGNWGTFASQALYSIVMIILCGSMFICSALIKNKNN